MADPVPPEITFKTAEILHYGGETTIGGLTSEMQAAKTKAAELRREKAGSASAKSFLETYKNKPFEKNLTRQNQEDLDLRFGAGEAKRNPGPPPTIDRPTTPEAKSLYDEAQAEIKNVNKFLQYSEITAEEKRTGKSITAILSERAGKGIDGPKTQADFDTQKDAVLDYIIDAEVIRIALPEVAAITNPVERRKLIEQTLATDPTLRIRITERMTSIAERLKALPEASVSKEVKDAEDSKTEAQVKITENLEMVKDKLKELGVDDTKAESLKKEVEKYIKDGKSLDQVLGYLRSSSMGGLHHVPEINAYIKANNSRDILQARLEKIDATKTVPSVIQAAEAQLEAAQKIINDFEADDNLVSEFDSYQDIIRTFTNQKDSSSSIAEGGIYLSPVANGIDQIVKAQKNILNADKVIKEKGEQSKKDQDAWKADRLVQESNLISEMQNIIPSSIAEVLSARYDEMVGLEKTRMIKVIEEEGKKGSEAIANGIKKVEDMKAKRWIEHNQVSRRKEVHDYNLSSDIKYAAYAGEDGIKRLILRDSGLQSKDAAGNPVAIDWKNADLSALPEDVKKTLEGIYANQKDPYKQKLFGDFFLGKRFLDRRVFGIQLGELALKKHEYELLQTKFGESFTQGINSKTEAKAAMEKLKASGIKANGGLLFLLALLFGAPFIGAKKALGIGE